LRNTLLSSRRKPFRAAQNGRANQLRSTLFEDDNGLRVLAFSRGGKKLELPTGGHSRLE
jgi:hypothetical protein